MRLSTLRFLPQGGIAGGALPWVIGVMVYLCTLAGGFGLALDRAVGAWAGTLSRQISVQIVHPEREERERQAAAAMDSLRTTPGIASVSRLGDEAAAALLEPWLGAGNVTGDLPVPILLDVTLAPGHKVDPAALAARLEAVAPDAALDDHERWLARLDRLATGLQATAGVVVGLVLAATAAIAAFGTRAGMASHRDSIEIMHLMGAEDRLIAGEFRYRFMLQGLKGGIGGLAAGAATLLSVDHFAEQLGRGLIPTLDLGWQGWMWLASLPLFAALLTMIAAHVTVGRDLARMP